MAAVLGPLACSSRSIWPRNRPNLNELKSRSCTKLKGGVKGAGVQKSCTRIKPAVGGGKIVKFTPLHP